MILRVASSSVRSNVLVIEDDLMGGGPQWTSPLSGLSIRWTQHTSYQTVREGCVGLDDFELIYQGGKADDHYA
jgi:hypothetical protein